MRHRLVRGAFVALSAACAMTVARAEAPEVPEPALEILEDSGSPNDNVVVFPETAVGNATSANITLFNSGTSALTVTAWEILFTEIHTEGEWAPSGMPVFRPATTNPPGAAGDVTLPPQAGHALALHFVPMEPQPYRAGLEIEYVTESGDPRFAWVSLSGDGIPTCAGDLDVSGAVDFEDILLLVAHWHEFCPGSGCGSDCNGDGYVDFQDFTCVLSAWGPCSD